MSAAPEWFRRAVAEAYVEGGKSFMEHGILDGSTVADPLWRLLAERAEPGETHEGDEDGQHWLLLRVDEPVV